MFAIASFPNQESNPKTFYLESKTNILIHSFIDMNMTDTAYTLSVNIRYDDHMEC